LLPRDLRKAATVVETGEGKSERLIMKALIAALAFVTLMSAPAFAQLYGQRYWQPPEYGQSPASPYYGGNGY
jgi:hypothetical protein